MKKGNIEPSQILRKREKIYKELNLAEETDAEKLIKLIVKTPNLLERLIVEVGIRLF